MAYFLSETVNVQRLSALIEHESVGDVERKQLKAYRKKIVDGSVRVSYQKRLDMGRRYADNSLSLQNFKKNIRHSLCYDNKMDMDMVNCHPVLLSQYCKKNGILSDRLDDYILHRDSRLQELMTACSIKRDLAKDFVLCMMYLGNQSDFMTTWGITSFPPKWLDEFQVSMKKISDMIVALNPAIHKKVTACKDKEHKNKIASTVSYVAQILEDDILMNAVSKLTELGFKVETLCFDGMLLTKKEMTEDTLSEVSAYCFQKTGYQVRFEMKQMTNVLNVEDTSSYDFSTFPFEHTDMYHQLYCSSLSSSSPEATYQLRKVYIERFMCKVMSPDACFIFQNGEEKEGVIVSEPFVYSAQSLSCLLRPIQSGFVSNSGTLIPFYDKWSCDPSQRIYRKYDFVPFVTKPPRSDIFNMFMGFNPVIFGEGESNLTVWFDLCLALCGDNEADAAYFHQFLANLFQEPTKRPPVAIVFKGKQGTGKNMALDTIGNMIGNDHYITSSKPSDFFGDHAEGFYRKLLVNINEAEGKDTFDFEGRIKSFITEPTITVNPKFVRPTNVSNHARLIITTNKPTPIPIDVKSKDRRYVVYETSDRFKQYGSATWTKMYKYFRTPAFMATLYKYYSTLDISQVDWINDRPITKAYRDMCNMFSPTEALFLENYIDSLDTKEVEFSVKSIDLFTEYETFCKSNRFTKDNNSPNSRAFIGRLNSLGLPMSQYKEHNAIHWKFVPADVYAFMTDRRWIGDYGQGEIKKEITVELDANLFG